MKQSISVDLLPTTIRKIETLAFLRQVDVTDQLEQMIDSIASQEILKELGMSTPTIQRHELPPLNNSEVAYTFSAPVASDNEEAEDLAGHSVSSDDDEASPEDEVSDEDDTEDENTSVDEDAEAEEKLTNDINEYLESISKEEESVTSAIREKKGLTKQTVEKPIGYTGEVPARKLGLSKHISKGAKVSALTSTSGV